MNDVRLHVPYIFGNKQISKTDRRETEKSEQEQKAQLKIETREAHGRPRQNKREAKLKHGNLQISKGLYIIIWYCRYKG